MNPTCKELIEYLSQFHPESAVMVAVYDCDGFKDAHEISGVNTLDFGGGHFPQLCIDTGCDHP